MIEINYNRVRELNSERVKANSWGLRLVPYGPLLFALRVLEWRHREILKLLFDEFEDLRKFNEIKPISPDQLSNILSRWKTKGLIDNESINKEVQKIKGNNSDMFDGFQ
jgi:hypothetical protein